ncbi:MAG: hypothetical protein ACTS41_00345 [Candidatus Hodgkinia cicadicola]
MNTFNFIINYFVQMHPAATSSAALNAKWTFNVHHSSDLSLHIYPAKG